MTGLSDDANENRDDVVLALPPRSQYKTIVIMQSHLGGFKLSNFMNLAIPYSCKPAFVGYRNLTTMLFEVVSIWSTLRPPRLAN